MPRKTIKVKITNPDLTKQINSENIKLMNLFLRDKGSRSSEKTIENYKSDILIFYTWNLLYNNNTFFIDIKKLQVSEFFIYATEELHFGSARYARLKSCLSSMSNFIERMLDDEYPNFRNIILKAVEPMPKEFVREKTVFSDEEINKLISDLEADGEIQIVCWLSLAIASGCRFSELLRFTLDLIDENNTAYEGIFLETTKAIRTKGRGRAGKQLKKYIIKDIFWSKYQQWLALRSEILNKNEKDHNSIFIKDNGDPATESTARGWVHKVQSYLDKPFYCHSLRHYSVSFLGRKKIRPELIKSLFGWEDVNLVFLYDDVEAKDKTWEELENLKQL